MRTRVAAVNFALRATGGRDSLPGDRIFTNRRHACLPPFPSLRLITELGKCGGLRGRKWRYGGSFDKSRKGYCAGSDT